MPHDAKHFKVGTARVFPAYWQRYPRFHNIARKLLLRLAEPVFQSQAKGHSDRDAKRRSGMARTLC
jgi:hypothetical protein